MPDVLVESADWTFGKPEFSFSPDNCQATARLLVVSGPDVVTMQGQDVLVTVTDDPRAAEARVTVTASTMGTLRVGALVPVLVVALLGGFLLNLMPCVLPVLSLKLLSVIDRRDAGRRRVRLGFLVTAAGVLTSMLLLAGTLAVLKLAGAVVGWGVQFQQPLFLVAMAAVLVAFSASLMGGFRDPAAVPSSPRPWGVLAGTGSPETSQPGPLRPCWRHHVRPRSSARPWASRWPEDRPRSWQSSPRWASVWPSLTCWSRPFRVWSA